MMSDVTRTLAAAAAAVTSARPYFFKDTLSALTSKQIAVNMVIKQRTLVEDCEIKRRCWILENNVNKSRTCNTQKREY